jgi:hypothetical protein
LQIIALYSASEQKKKYENYSHLGYNDISSKLAFLY